MRISTDIASAANLVGEEKAVELIAKAGFDGWDFSMFEMCKYDWAQNCAVQGNHPLSGPDYLKFARELKKIGLDNGIVCNQSHAPFPTSDMKIRSYLKRAIECTAEAGGTICVIHPDNKMNAEQNGEFYCELLPFAKEHGVKIATENMWSWDKEENQASFAACATPESFLSHLNMVNDESFVACLDIGHAEMRGVNTSAVEMIEALGAHLQALHLHDNDQWKDSHQIPFSMNIDFGPVVRALKKIGYSGWFTLEADRYLKTYTEQTAFAGICELAKSAKKLAQMFDACS